MLNNKFKEEFANKAAGAFQTLFSDKYIEIGDKQVFSAQFILDNIEKPKDPTKGRFAFPVFRYGKLLGDNPPSIASKITEAINSSDNNLITVSSIAGFINIQTEFAIEASETIKNAVENETKYGSSDVGNGKKVLVEYSSPNIAKPFGVNHIRTTILGNSLRRIFLKLGYETIGINYLGDWGTQFGKMIVAYKKWADPSLVGKETVTDLLALYVRFHDEAEENKELENQAREEFKKLESGDAENRALWEKFREISINEFNRVYDIMGIEFDWVTGEAFLNDKMTHTIKAFEKANLVSESEGATIVNLHDEQLPPVLLKKADGATLYLTRDLSGYLYRANEFNFDEMLYVVAVNQSVHFQQMFKALAMLEDAQAVPEEKRMSSKGKHVEFGMIKFGDKMMKTRKGHIILLEDVINEAAKLAKEKIEEKTPDLKNIDDIALQIGLGAIFYSQMSVRRQKDVNFKWEEVLSFEGETGPYLQYTHARLISVLRKFEIKKLFTRALVIQRNPYGENSILNFSSIIDEGIDYSLLNFPEEKRIVELVADFPQAVADAARMYEPNMIANHLIELAGAFNKFYQRKDANGKTDKIISDNYELCRPRIVLVKAVQIVIKEGLYLLGIKAPEAM